LLALVLVLERSINSTGANSEDFRDCVCAPRLLFGRARGLCHQQPSCLLKIGPDGVPQHLFV